jgi:hypothetical protein
MNLVTWSSTPLEASLGLHDSRFLRVESCIWGLLSKGGSEGPCFSETPHHKKKKKKKLL